MPKIYQNVGVPAAPVFNFSANGPATIPGNLRQKYDSYHSTPDTGTPQGGVITPPTMLQTAPEGA
jgi:hypothetical protein